MMYSEFIERTTFTESYITPAEYEEYIEPAYMLQDNATKTEFCKWFYKLHRERVSNVVLMLIASKSLEEKEAFCGGCKNIMANVEEINATLKTALLKTLRENYILTLKYPKDI